MGETIQLDIIYSQMNLKYGIIAQQSAEVMNKEYKCFMVS